LFIAPRTYFLLKNKFKQAFFLMSMPAAEKLYTLRFMVLCSCVFLFFGSFNMIIPELPSRLSQLGGSEYKGWIITLFTITAGLSRPFSGKLADTIGRLPVMAFGIVVNLLCTLAYPWIASVSVFLSLRLLHGFSTGFTPTGNSAYIADIVPVNRRGEALGVVGFSGTLALSASPVLGSWLVNTFSFETMIFTSTIMSLSSLLILASMKETLPHTQGFSPALLWIPPKQVLEPSAFSASVVMVLVYVPFGMMLILTPDLSEYWGLENKGFLLMVFTLASMAARIVGGKASDKYGREIVLKIGSLGLAAGLFCMGFAYNQLTIIVFTAIFGIFMGLAPPTIYAWAIDRAAENRRAQALSTVYIALEIGIGSGAWLGTALYDNDPARFPWAFWAGSLATVLAWVFLMIRSIIKDRK
jgi:MFS family permease